MSSDAVGHCVHCTDPVHGVHADADPAAHPCCVFWMGDEGLDRCPSCELAKAERKARSEPDYEAQARSKAARLARCELCDGLLWLDQPGAHHVCARSGRRVPRPAPPTARDGAQGPRPAGAAPDAPERPLASLAPGATR